MVKILIKKLDPEVKLPEYKTNGASGMYLKAYIKKTINLKSIFNIGLIFCIVSFLSFLIIRGQTAIDYLNLYGSFLFRLQLKINQYNIFFHLRM